MKVYENFEIPLDNKTLNYQKITYLSVEPITRNILQIDSQVLQASIFLEHSTEISRTGKVWRYVTTTKCRELSRKHLKMHHDQFNFSHRHFVIFY